MVLCAKAVAAALLVLAAVLCAVQPSSAVVTEVNTQYGRIKGTYDAENKLVIYFGVPYAAPPVGSLRLQPPQAPTPWNTTRDCTRDLYFHICPQFDSKLGFLGKEDCLYMNIYVPVEAEEETLPVMFWIYGGGYSIGDDGEFGWYRGRNLASTERVIVVEHNYRLGLLGFLGSSLLRSETALNTTGNFGVQDQQRALNFTHNNIANFGGDPQRLVIFGESAGAFSVCWHLVSPISRGLFTAAIMESGTCKSAEFFVSQQRADIFAKEIFQKLGCDSGSSAATINCLRSKKTEDMFMAKGDWPIANGTAPPLAPIMPWGPVIDGSAYGLLDRPYELILQGKVAPVPVIMGINKDEGTLFVPSLTDVVPGVDFPLTDAGVNVTLQHFFNVSTASAVMSLYPASMFKSQFDRVAIILRDFFFLCPTADALAAVNRLGQPTYMYLFDMDLKNWIDYDVLGNYHTSELSLVFDNQWPPLIHNFDAREKTMSESFRLYWSNMARFGDPNHNLTPDQVYWPTFDGINQTYIHMDVPTRQDTRPQATFCNFWRNHYSKYYFN